MLLFHIPGKHTTCTQSRSAVHQALRGGLFNISILKRIQICVHIGLSRLYTFTFIKHVSVPLHFTPYIYCHTIDPGVWRLRQVLEGHPPSVVCYPCETSHIPDLLRAGRPSHTERLAPAALTQTPYSVSSLLLRSPTSRAEGVGLGGDVLNAKVYGTVWQCF